MEDTLKFSGPMEQASQARQDYREFHAERPIIKKLQDNIPVHPTNGAYYDGQVQSTQRDYGHVESKRPIINKLHDNLKMEGDVDLQTAYKQSYVPAESVRPEIKRMNSTLAVASGDFVTESVIKADFPEHRVQRPTIAKPVGQIEKHDASWGDGIKPAGARRTSQKHADGIGYFQTGPSMNRIRQMESHIQFGNGDQPAMMSEAQGSYTPLEGAQKSQMMRPRTSNRLQDWNMAGEPTRRGRHALNGNANNVQAPMTRDQIVKEVRDRKQNIVESSLPLNQPGQPMEVDGSLYKKSYLLPAIEPCPASVLNADDKSNYKFSREMHNHRFYKPINSLA